MPLASLFDPIPPYQSESITSIEASGSMVGKTATLREKVYDLLRTESLTDEQIAIRLNMSPNTARPRRVELCEAGRIAQVGMSTTLSGRRASLWGVPPSIGICA